jgi:UDP-glucose 4-epimerase
MTTLVTGALGFTGINIVRSFAEAGESVVAMGHRPARPECHRFLEGLEDKVHVAVGDVLQPESVLSLAEHHGVRRLVHAAAITPSGDVEQSIPRHIVSVNLMGTVNMLEVARRISADRFVFVSSAGVYGVPASGGALVTEDSALSLGALYSICKYASELLVRRYDTLFSLSTVSGRMSSIYGPMERATASRGNPSRIFKLVRALLAGRPVKMRGQDLTRSFTHVEDAAAIFRQLTLKSALHYDLYNVAAGHGCTLGEVLKTLQDLDPTFSYTEAAPGEEADVEIAPDGERGTLDISRAREEFDFSPRYDLRSGLESYIRWASHYPELFEL